ncbi:unnamed protein product [Moneuplotes crassus]|uniref:Uncharacterized protein n=1 Tax=Euplotes crassus TaxID=5936 RepID=A0AAD1UMH3_EUPCR|nr:unnamed protein product [Moneuplotes crassus]
MMMKNRAKPEVTTQDKKEALIKKKKEEKRKQLLEKKLQEQKRKEVFEKLQAKNKPKPLTAKNSTKDAPKSAPRDKNNQKEVRLPEPKRDTEESRLEERMRIQKLKALRKAKAQERALGIHSNTELDSEINRISLKRQEKPKPREIKEKAKSRPSNTMISDRNLSKAQLIRQAEILRRKNEMLKKRKLSEEEISRPRPSKEMKPRVSTREESKKPIKKEVTYFCSVCNFEHGADYHRKKFEERERIQQPSKRPSDLSSTQSKRRKIIEEDDDLDGFIVRDNLDESNMASNVIKKLYGHNKHDAYYSDDEDDMCMEAGYDQIEKEEFISKKIGQKEDQIEYKRMLARGEIP